MEIKEFAELMDFEKPVTVEKPTPAVACPHIKNDYLRVVAVTMKHLRVRKDGVSYDFGVGDCICGKTYIFKMRGFGS